MYVCVGVVSVCACLCMFRGHSWMCVWLRGRVKFVRVKEWMSVRELFFLLITFTCMLFFSTCLVAISCSLMWQKSLVFFPLLSV